MEEEIDPVAYYAERLHIAVARLLAAETAKDIRFWQEAVSRNAAHYARAKQQRHRRM